MEFKPGDIVEVILTREGWEKWTPVIGEVLVPGKKESGWIRIHAIAPPEFIKFLENPEFRKNTRENHEFRACPGNIKLLSE